MLLLVGGAGGLAVDATAAEPPTAARLWKDASGSFEFQGELVRVLSDTVILKRPADGREIAVPLVRLSQQDREFLRGRSAPQGTANETAAAKSLVAVTFEFARNRIVVSGLVLHKDDAWATILVGAQLRPEEAGRRTVQIYRNPDDPTAPVEGTLFAPALDGQACLVAAPAAGMPPAVELLKAEPLVTESAHVLGRKYGLGDSPPRSEAVAVPGIVTRVGTGGNRAVLELQVAESSPTGGGLIVRGDGKPIGYSLRGDPQRFATRSAVIGAPQRSERSHVVRGIPASELGVLLDPQLIRGAARVVDGDQRKVTYEFTVYVSDPGHQSLKSPQLAIHFLPHGDYDAVMQRFPEPFKPLPPDAVVPLKPHEPALGPALQFKGQLTVATPDSPTRQRFETRLQWSGSDDGVIVLPPILVHATDAPEIVQSPANVTKKSPSSVNLSGAEMVLTSNSTRFRNFETEQPEPHDFQDLLVKQSKVAGTDGIYIGQMRLSVSMGTDQPTQVAYSRDGKWLYSLCQFDYMRERIVP
ncbi:MAG: hypothetical protein K8T25_18180 [Planctomycetia bacterium]|nr:hypothetical protein [Planctomycetia bacterium]